MIGGTGIDRFVEDSVANGSDVMVGGSEPEPHRPLDDFYRGDEVSYADRVNPIRADLEGDPDDGEPGEGDQIGSDVASIVGGAGADILIGSAVGNWLDGGPGADLLTGGAGDDGLVGGRKADRSADRLRAGPGSDYVYGGGGDDSLYGGPGVDEVRGGAGRDRIRPGLSIDVIFGGPGNDVLWTRDRQGEDVECGGGWDRVLPDRHLDSVKDGCERELGRPSRPR
jgi:Ca2+-binding RTX toxin-like protein